VTRSLYWLGCCSKLSGMERVRHFMCSSLEEIILKVSPYSMVKLKTHSTLTKILIKGSQIVERQGSAPVIP